jgi:hypothetical protein
MSEASEPTSCPTCQTEARRVFSLPGLYRTTELDRKVRNRAEQGSEPRVQQANHSHEHGQACNHQHGKHGQHGQHPTAHKHGPTRPWMLGHC